MRLRDKIAVTGAVFVGAAAAALVVATATAPRSVDIDPAGLSAFQAIQASVAPPRLATASEARSTVVLATCTATKVGPRLYLSAAHCVVDAETGALKAWLRPPFPTTLSNRLDSDAVSDGDVEAQAIVGQIHIHPDYRWDLSAAYLEEEYRPDVALLVTDRAVDGIPITPIGDWRVEPGTELVLVGTRPPDSEPTDAAPASRRVKWIPSKAVEFDPYYPFEPQKLGRALLLTTGLPDSYAGYAIGFGDSGGPVLQWRDGNLYVVGVHAVTFAATDGHTRLDDESGFGVASWLRGLGATVVQLTSTDASGDDRRGD